MGEERAAGGGFVDVGVVAGLHRDHREPEEREDEDGSGNPGDGPGVVVDGGGEPLVGVPHPRSSRAPAGAAAWAIPASFFPAGPVPYSPANLRRIAGS